MNNGNAPATDPPEPLLPRHLTLDLPGAIIPPFAGPACLVAELPIRRLQLPLKNEVARENSSANADIAQLVEQVIRNDQVVGSNPTIGSNYNPMSE